MNYRSVFLIILFATFSISTQAQGPHDRLIEITRKRAADIASVLSLSEEGVEKLSGIYVKEALAIEDLIVNADPEVAIIKQIHAIEKTRVSQVKEILDDTEYDLYKYVLEEEEKKQQSRFDSLQIHLDDEEFAMKITAYYDDNVVPYLVYYHQTYFKPALKQKHYWKINQSRQSLYDYEEMKMNGAEGKVTAPQLSEALANLGNSISALKRIRKRYRDELDYITVALGPVERIWSDDYIKIVQEQFEDDVFLKIRDYSHSMNAYGMDYILGELSMVLFDVWNPRSYIESRQTLAEMFRTSLR